MPSSKSLKVSNYKTHAKHHHHSLHGTHKKRANQARKLRLADEEEEIIKMEEQKEFRKVLEDQVSRVNPEDLSPLPECRGLRIEDENPFAQLMMIMLQYQSFRSYPMYSEDDQVQEEQIKLQKASRFELMKQKRAIRREKRKVFKTLKRSISEVNPGDPSSSSTEQSNNKRIKLSHQNIQQHQLQFIPNISSSNPLEHPSTVTARFDLMESNYMSEEEDDSNSSFHDDIYTLYNQTWDYQDSVNEFYQEEDSSTADSVDIDSLLVPSPVVFKPATSFTNCELIQALDQHQRQKQQQNQQHMVVSQVPVIHVSQPELRTQNHLIQQPWQSTAVQQSTTTTTTTATTTKTIPSYIPQQPPVIVKPVTVERTPVNILDQLHRSNNLVYAQQRQAQMGFVNI